MTHPQEAGIYRFHYLLGSLGGLPVLVLLALRLSVEERDEGRRLTRHAQLTEALGLSLVTGLLSLVKP